MNRGSNKHNITFLLLYYVIYVHYMFRPERSLSDIAIKLIGEN